MANVISIIGAKEGVGATTLSSNLAFALQKVSGKKVLLINLAYDGELSFVFGQNGNVRTFADVASLLQRANPSIVEGALRVNAKGIGLIERGLGLPADGIKDYMNQLGSIYPFIIIDAGSSLNTDSVAAIEASNNILFAISSDAFVISEAEKKVQRFIKSFLTPESFTIVAAKWEESPYLPRSCVGDKIRANCRHWLGQYPQVSASLKRGQVFYLDDARHAYCEALDGLASELMKSDNSGNLSHVHWQGLIGQRAQKELGPAVDGVANKPLTENALPAALSSEADQLKREILEKLLDAADLKNVSAIGNSNGEALYAKAEGVILQLLGNIEASRLANIDRKLLVKEILDEALGLGPLEVLLSDKSVSEIMVNARDQIYVERGGKLMPTPYRFASESQLLRIIERIVSPIGRRIDESSPMVDARLADGSRVNIVIPPLALKGPTITIRKFAAKPLKIDDLIRFGALTEPMAKFLAGCVKGRLNVLVAGGTGSGKTTLLNVLSSFIPDDERIVTVEDAAELQLHQAHVVRLESRPANIEGRGAVTIRDLVKNALRMRPDRIVVGECRGGEALDMLQAMNTGHDGSLTTVHANSPRDSIARLETLVMFAGIELPSRAIREQIVAAIDLIVQLNRLSDGSRRIVQITEVSGMEGDTVTMQDIFSFKQSGIGPDGKVNGSFNATGFRPKFAEAFKAKGIELM